MAHVLNNIGAENSQPKGDLFIQEAISYCGRELQQCKLPDVKHPDLEGDRDTREFISVLFDQKSLVYARQAYDVQMHLFPTVHHPRTTRLLLSIDQSYSNFDDRAKKQGDVIPSLMNLMRYKLQLKRKKPVICNSEYSMVESIRTWQRLGQSLGESLRERLEFRRALYYFERDCMTRVRTFTKKQLIII